MKFTITYEGELSASGNSPKRQAKWNIRKKIHPQLVELSQTHAVLRNALQDSKIPRSGHFQVKEYHHSGPEDERPIARD